MHFLAYIIHIMQLSCIMLSYCGNNCQHFSTFFFSLFFGVYFPFCSVVSNFFQPHGAHQAPLSIGFSRQEYWSGLPCPSPGDLPNPGMEPGSLALQADSLPSKPTGMSSFSTVDIIYFPETFYFCFVLQNFPISL